jgi:predicted DNA-binding transcriptional regulator YafY
MSESLNSAERRLKLITMLQAHRVGNLRVDDIACEFGVSRRTVFRDLRMLSNMSIPIESDRDYGYRMSPQNTIPPLMFSEQELSTLIVGLGFLKGQVDSGLSKEARNIELKIQSMLNERLNVYMKIISEKVVLYPYPHRSEEDEPNEHWHTLLSAIKESKAILATYTSLKTGKISERRIDPYLLVYYGDHWDLIGYCNSANSLRTFVLSRFFSVSVLSDSYITRRGYSTHDLLHRINADYQKLWISAKTSVSERVLRSLPAIVESVELVEQEVHICFQFDNLRFINQWLLQFGNEVKVIAPDAFVKDRVLLLQELLT